jgi:glutaredoxin-related protein
MNHKNCDRDAAKTLCISIMFGAKPTSVPAKVKGLIVELDKISTNIIAQYPEVYAICKKKENPKASCLANVLQDMEIFENLPRYADWPTFPQLFVQGELIGGADIVAELAEAGELARIVAEAESA